MDSTYPTSWYSLIVLFFLVLCFKSLNANWTLPFSFEDFDENSSSVSLFGDAQLVTANVSYLQLSGSVVSSAGRVMYREPIKLFERNPTNLVSFTTEFVFSLTGENGDGLAFVLVPNGFPRASVFTNGSSFGMPQGRKFKFIAVEFDTLINQEFHDVNDNHVGIDVNTFVSSKISNLSSANLVLKSGEKLKAWVDYEASGQRLQVRLTKLGGIRPVDPLLSYPINLSKIWGSTNVFVGLSSSNGNSLQKCNVYSWSLKHRTTPWMHSEPLDPNTIVKKEDDKIQPVDQKRECAMRIFTALIFGTGCGALGAILVLFLWIVLGNKVPGMAPAVAASYSVQAKAIEYEKTATIS